MNKNTQIDNILYLSLRGIYDEAIHFTKLFSGLPRSLSFARNDGIKLSTINQTQSTAQSAFTLVELAIVIVIIGLLVGGVLQGQELIRAAGVQDIVKSLQSYNSAVTQFKGKYNCLPGDCINAYNFFGDSCDTTPSNCNGDGDGLVFYNATPTDDEVYRFWQHLVLSKILVGNFTGVSSASSLGTSEMIDGKLFPKLKIKDTYVGVMAYNNHVAGVVVSPTWSPNSIGLNQNYFMVGHARLEGGYAVPYKPFLSPDEAYSVDLKMDDGKPNMGKVFIWNDNGGWQSGHVANCSNSYASTADYLFSYKDIACHINYGF